MAEIDGYFSADARTAILRDLSKNDQTDAQVRSVITILQDAVDEPLDNMHDFLQEMLPVDILFSHECLTNYRIYSCVRNVLLKLGVPVPTDMRTLISIKVARALYTNVDDADDAVERVEAWRRTKNVRASPSDQPSNSPTAIHVTTRGTSSNDSYTMSRNKATVVSSFKDEEKFSGSVSGKVPLHRVRNKFIDAIRDHAIPRTEEVNLMHCCLSGMALDFYYKSIRGIYQTVDQAFVALSNQFNSLQHQAQARTYLTNLTVEGIKREKNCTMLQALETAHTRICDTVPNCGKEYQQQSHYCDFLQRMVERQHWAKAVIQARLTPGPDSEMDYNTFYSKLCAALTVELGEHQESDAETQEGTGTVPAFFGERYAVPRHKTSGNGSRRHQRNSSHKTNDHVRSMLRGPNRIRRRLSASQLAQLKAKTRCLSCRKLGHWRHECPERGSTRSRDTMMSFIQELGNDNEAVAQTLLAVSEDDDEWYAYLQLCEGSSVPGDSPEESNAFETLITDVSPYGDRDALAEVEADEHIEDISPAIKESSTYIAFKDDTRFESPIATAHPRPVGEPPPSIDPTQTDTKTDTNTNALPSPHHSSRPTSKPHSKPQPTPKSPPSLYSRVSNRQKRYLRRLVERRMRSEHKRMTKPSSKSLTSTDCALMKRRQRRQHRLRRRCKNAKVYIIPTKVDRLHPSVSSTFQGGAVDTGAQRAVIGLPQAKAYCREVGIDFQPVRSHTLFRFGAGRSKSIGKIPIIIPTPQTFLTVWVDVVPEDIPFLIGLDILDKYSLQVLSVYNELECVREGWRTPVIRKFGLIYWEWSNEIGIHFTKPQLERLHRHLLHPSTRKLYNLLRRAKPEDLTPQTMDTLKEIQKTCETCQMYAPKQLVFRIRDTEAIRFNHEILLDVMYLKPRESETTRRRTRSSTKSHNLGDQSKGIPVLHIVDVGTKFQAAEFLTAMDTNTIWNTFVKLWATTYTGFPESMLTDQGSVFVSKEWSYNCELAEIELRHTGTESHNSLGAGETYHALLRRVYNKTLKDHPKVSSDMCLALTVKAINSTVGPDGLCPQLLVFGVLPKLPSVCPQEYPIQKERFRALQTARDEYERLVSRKLVDRGIKTIPPPAADHKYMPGDFVYVYREGVKHYTGPHLIASVDGKQIRLHVGERTGPRTFNIAQLRPAPLARLQSMDEMLTADNAGPPRVLYTEVLPINDPRAHSPLFDDAKRKELLGLIERGTFRVVLQEEAGQNPNIIPCRFVLAIKHSDTGEIKYKARFVLGGHRDKDKDSIVHNTANIKQSSIRLIIALATILGFDVWSLDVRQAYIQSASELQRDVFIKPKELDLDPQELLQIIKPLYGLSDSGDYWCETFARFHIHDLRMQQTTGDFALFFRRSADKLVALSGSYVDDVLQASPASLKKEIQRQIQKRFDITVADASQFIYTGIMCDTSNPSLRTLSQAHYIKRLQFLSATADFKQFRSLRAKLLWIVHTRPDIACAASFASQVTPATFSKTSVDLMNRTVHHLKNTPSLMLKYPKLDLETLQLVVYSDSGFANLADGKSQLGFIICLADKSSRCAVIHFSSRKSSRVARSTMAAETLAFVDSFDNVYFIKHDLERLLGRQIPVTMFTDCQLLFDAFTRSRYTTERRLMIDIASAREAYLDGLIFNIGLVRSEHNPADSLTKLNGNKALELLLRRHRLQHPVQQYIIRSKQTSTGART